MRLQVGLIFLLVIIIGKGVVHAEMVRGEMVRAATQRNGGYAFAEATAYGAPIHHSPFPPSLKLRYAEHPFTIPAFAEAMACGAPSHYSRLRRGYGVRSTYSPFPPSLKLRHAEHPFTIPAFAEATACGAPSHYSSFTNQDPIYIITLGITQDGGYPHIGCSRACCSRALIDPKKQKHVVSLALVDPAQKKWWLLEATPDITAQLNLFAEKTGHQFSYLPEGILLTHAHIGHYTGLMYLGREALGAKQMPVYVLPKLKAYLEKNGPWSQLVQLQNIALRTLTADSIMRLNENVSITAFTVPHRDEFSETAGFQIQGGDRKFLFIPDTDKWSKFTKSITELVAESDLAFLDATFLSAQELAYRNISEVPHPYVEETIGLFSGDKITLGKKIVFIHFNHTNPLLWDVNEKAKVVLRGFQVAEEGKVY